MVYSQKCMAPVQKFARFLKNIIALVGIGFSLYIILNVNKRTLVKQNKRFNEQYNFDASSINRTTTFQFATENTKTTRNYVTTTFGQNIAKKGEAIFTLQELKELSGVKTQDVVVNKLCTHSQRLEHLYRTCQTVKPVYNDSRFVIDDRRKLMFCEVSKSGCTTWKALWQGANNSTLNQRIKTSNLLAVHTKYMKYAKLKLIKQKYTQDINYSKYQDYTKFISVRHPLDRVLSAYFNIIHSGAGIPGPGPPARAKIAQAFNFVNLKEQLTLNHLVQFITDPDLSGIFYHDRHWKPYSETCKVCDIKYDYIIRLETSTHDSGPVLEMLDYPPDHFLKTSKLHGRPGENNKQTFVTSSYLKPFQNVSQTLMNRLIQRYQVDLALFGYHFDTLSMKATCQITDQNGNICC